MVWQGNKRAITRQELRSPRISLLQVLVQCLGPRMASAPHAVATWLSLTELVSTLAKVNGFLKNSFFMGLRCLSSFRIHNCELSSGMRYFKPFIQISDNGSFPIKQGQHRVQRQTVMHSVSRTQSTCLM